MRRARTLAGERVVRLGGGLQVRARHVGAAAFLAALALGLALVGLGVGATRTGPLDLLAAVLGDAPEADTFALLTVRGPRIVLGFLAGACVAVAGAMLQAVARNPLADPGLLGLSQGSMVMIMALVVLVPDAPPALVPVAAVAGGLLVAGGLVLLAGRAHTAGLAILLMGIAAETMLSAVGSILILYSPPEASYALGDWLAGTLFTASWSTIAALVPFALAGAVAVALIGRALEAYEMGEEMAMALGESVTRSRPALVFIAVLLNAAAVSAVGPLSFLGVMAPQLAGLLAPASGRPRLVLSALTGGALVIAADTLARAAGGDALGGGIALPIGLSLTLVGVPLFVVAMRLRALRTLA